MRRQPASRHDASIARSARYSRAASAAGREVGPVPPVANKRRRSRTRLNFRTFCETYMRSTFAIAWSDDHLRAIEKIERAVLHGELFAFAMPRGSGKSSLVSAAALWSLLHGHHPFVVIVGPDEGHGRRMLEAIWLEIETNDALAADFPETCHPIRSLERSTQRARGQLCDGENTRIEKTAAHFTLPAVRGSKASGSTLRALGITASLRGLTHKRPDGTTIRPSLVLVDDVQTDEVSGSPKQIADRLAILNGAVLGLAGPRKTISGLCTVTVIRPNDLADQLLDRQRNPAWQGERSSLVYEWPDAETLWSEYADMRRDGQRSGAGVAAATAFYRERQVEMDAGSRVAWNERHNEDELSAIQHAWNLRIDRGESAFWAEYQNQPLAPVLEAAVLSLADLRSRALPLARGLMPQSHSTLTMAIDIQADVLFWLVGSWGPQFSGHVVAYGSHPEQPQSVFAANAIKRRLRDVHDGGFEAVLLAGLQTLVDSMIGRDWPREDGTAHRIDAITIDANWGRSTSTVREFCRRHPSAALIHPAHGVGIGATAAPLNDGRRKAGERIGPGWRLGTIGGQRGVRHDTNWWKSFVAARLATPVGDPGALTFHAGTHDMLLEHLTSESPVTVEARGRTVEEWRLRVGRENHYFDCAVMAAMAASIAGVTAVGTEVAGRRRRRVEIPALGERRVIQVRRLAP
jgi:hypothetical protein